MKIISHDVFSQYATTTDLVVSGFGLSAFVFSTIAHTFPGVIAPLGPLHFTVHAGSIICCATSTPSVNPSISEGEPIRGPRPSS